MESKRKKQMAKKHTEGSIAQKTKELRELQLKRLDEPSEEINARIAELESDINYFHYGGI